MADAMKLVPVERDRLARAVYAARPARMLHPEERPLTWEEAVQDVPDRVAQIYQDVDAMLAASPPAREEAPADGAGDNAEHWRERALSAEASMLALRRIEDAKVFCEIETSDIWSVHVRGPDETVAAKSYADAVSYCDKLNAECPDARAVPILSPHKGSPVVLSAYDVACYEYPDATGAPLRDAFALGAMYASTNLRARTSEPAREACYDCSTDRPHTTTESCNPAPATADKLKVAVEALEKIANKKHISSVGVARLALAALNEQPQ